MLEDDHSNKLMPLGSDPQVVLREPSTKGTPCFCGVGGGGQKFPHQFTTLNKFPHNVEFVTFEKTLSIKEKYVVVLKQTPTHQFVDFFLGK